MCGLDASKKRMIYKFYSVLFVVIALLSTTSMLCFAEETTTSAVVNTSDNLDVSIAEIMKSEPAQMIKKSITLIANPLATVSFGACLLGIILTRSGKRVEEYLVGLKAIVWGFFLLNGLGLFLTAIGTMIGTHVYQF